MIFSHLSAAKIDAQVGIETRPINNFEHGTCTLWALDTTQRYHVMQGGTRV